MKTAIAIDFNADRRRLVLKADFMYLDVLRALPSRRFDSKTKAWHAPLVKSNVRYLQGLEGRVDFAITPAAQAAMNDLDRLSAPPALVPFPREWFDGKRPPMPHQWEMLDRGWGLRGYALFATMGLGKTYTTIHTAMARHAAGHITRLLIDRKSVV